MPKKTAVSLMQWCMAVIIVGGVTWTFNLSYATHESQAQHVQDENPHAAVMDLTQAKIDGKLAMIEENLEDLTAASHVVAAELRVVRDEQIVHRVLLEQINKSINGGRGR